MAGKINVDCLIGLTVSNNIFIQTTNSKQETISGVYEIFYPKHDIGHWMKQLVDCTFIHNLDLNLK